MRISDWSSDVCSSDLTKIEIGPVNPLHRHSEWSGGQPVVVERHRLQMLDQRRTRVPGRVRRKAGDVVALEARDRHCNEADRRSEEHTSELQSLMRISYAVFCLKKKNKSTTLSSR